jgi:murein DD-endopeptidase MepM/ murein hydrolase activator NlpD
LLTRAHKDVHSRARVIEIGDEPPLRLDGGTAGVSSRHVNLRWLAGTSLGGVLAAGLLGAAILTSMNGAYRLAEAPGFMPRWEPGASDPRSSNTPRKGDRIVAAPVDANRQILRISTSTKVGDRETVKTRPVTRIGAGLMMSGVDTNIPAFNPTAMFGDDGPAASTEADASPAEDGDISFVVRNLAEIDADLSSGPTIPLEQVVANVRDVGVIEAVQSTAFQALGGTQPELASLDASAPLPNLTVITKKPREESSGNEGERTIIVSQGETLDQLLVAQGVSAADARDITAAFGAPSGYGTASLVTGQTVKLLVARVGVREQPVRVIIESGTSQSIVALSDTGGYVAVADAPEIVEEGPALAEETGGSGLSLYQAFYGTARQRNVPEPVLKEMVRVFSNDVDFQRKAGRADRFEVLFASDENGAVDGPPEIMFASLATAGDVRRYYRYQLPDGGFDFFDENGRSARKFLMRKPVSAGVMRSGFGMRRHPILGFSKMHTGVDWSAPRGTPIYAAGNGVIKQAARSSGYGNQIKIQHANGYETAYAHMTSFARGMKVGTRVRQGQLVGYVGSTGLSTGPHLHFEVLVNGRFVNPMRIKVPRGRELEGQALAEFQRERERIDSIVGRPASGTQLTSVSAKDEGG